MNGIINKLLLTRDKFMSEMHLTQPGFTYWACGTFTKKQRKNTKIQRKRKFTIYLSNGIR